MWGSFHATKSSLNTIMKYYFYIDTPRWPQAVELLFDRLLPRSSAEPTAPSCHIAVPCPATLVTTRLIFLALPYNNKNPPSCVLAHRHHGACLVNVPRCGSPAVDPSPVLGPLILPTHILTILGSYSCCDSFNTLDLVYTPLDIATLGR